MTPRVRRRAAVGTVLIVARTPVPGRSKTRLAASVGAGAAADIAAAALLDTIDAARAGAEDVVVALTGGLEGAARRDELDSSLSGVTVIDQRGRGLGERLAIAHADTHARRNGDGGAVFQIGMDTPQVTPALLGAALAAAGSHDAVLGPASDGGWWGLAVADPRTVVRLSGVAMSTPETGALTRAALESAGAAVHPLRVLRDVDEWADALAVARQAPDGRFAAAVTERVGSP